MKLMEYGVIDRTKIMVCCICQESIKPTYLGKDYDGNDAYWYEGNNPEPIEPITNEKGERNSCCNECNAKIVVPARITEITLHTKGKGKFSTVKFKKKGKEDE